MTVRHAFDRLLARARRRVPGLDVRLEWGRFQGVRAFGSSTGPVIRVSRRLGRQPAGRIRGVLAHELGHSVLLHLGRLEHTERDADALAERLLGVGIGYDDDGVQTTDPRSWSTRHRPAWLPNR